MIFVTLCFLITAGIGLVCLIGYRRTRQQLRLLRLVATCPIAELHERIPGEMVEITGTVHCATPLRSEYTGQPCVYYRTVTERVVERQGRSKKGGRLSEVVAQNEQRIAFEVDDGTGRVAVDPVGAEIDGRKLLDRFEPVENGKGATLRIAGMSVEVRAAEWRTLGYRKIEETVLVGYPVYVLGVLQDDGSIGRPPEGSRLREFLISARSEEELATSLRQRSYLFLAGAITSFVVAGMLLIVLLVQSVISII
jgi:hypothetical protein